MMGGSWGEAEMVGAFGERQRGDGSVLGRGRGYECVLARSRDGEGCVLGRSREVVGLS